MKRMNEIRRNVELAALGDSEKYYALSSIEIFLTIASKSERRCKGG